MKSTVLLTFMLYDRIVDSSVKPRFENHIVLKDPKIKRQTISNPKYYVVYPEKENLMAVSRK